MDYEAPFVKRPVPEYRSPFQVDLPVQCTNPERAASYSYLHFSNDNCPIHRNSDTTSRPIPRQVDGNWQSWVEFREDYATMPPGTDHATMEVLLGYMLNNVTLEYPPDASAAPAEKDVIKVSDLSFADILSVMLLSASILFVLVGIPLLILL